MSEPTNGDRAVCVTCGTMILFIEYAQFNGIEDDVLDAWWAHAKHPVDNHDAVPVQDRLASAQLLLTQISQWVTGSYVGVDPEAVLWRRVTKVAEEAGEAVGALGGMLGENPRKGVTHSREDLIQELLDVAVAALGAVEHVTEHKGLALTLLDQKIATVAQRAGLL